MTDSQAQTPLTQGANPLEDLAGNVVNATPALKAGPKTTEFWITALTLVGSFGATVAGVVPGKTGLIAGAIASAAYALSRGLAKALHPFA